MRALFDVSATATQDELRNGPMSLECNLLLSLSLSLLVSVLIKEPSDGARNVLSYTRGMMQNCIAFRQSYHPIKTLVSFPFASPSRKFYGESGDMNRHFLYFFFLGVKQNLSAELRLKAWRNLCVNITVRMKIKYLR